MKNKANTQRNMPNALLININILKKENKENSVLCVSGSAKYG
jgi:hypothetical protein